MTKVDQEKVLQFTGFLSSVGKTFTDFVFKIMKKAITQKILRENFS